MKAVFKLAIFTMAVLGTFSCGKGPSGSESTVSEKSSKVPAQEFGRRDGKPVAIYTLKNSKGIEARITEYGATLVSLKIPDRSGSFADVVLGFDTLDGYLQTPPPPYFGATVGRYANRIGKARFTLNGKAYTLDKNNGENSLHGGVRGFDKVVWAAEVQEGDANGVKFSYLSKDGEGGYPGNLNVDVIYTLDENNELKIDYHATTDQDTVINLTNHSYFNLAGHNGGDILGHLVMINADRFTPIDSGLIPTGELSKVEGTPFDFRQAKAVGERINATNEQIKFGKGYDHNWVINNSGSGLALAARVTEPISGRVVETLTTEPGIQFYTGNFLDGSMKGKGGVAYQYRHGLTLETQHFPDSPNHPEFPTTTLKKGDAFRSTTVFRFSTAQPAK